MPYFIGTREIHCIGEEICTKLAYPSTKGIPQVYEDIIATYNATNPFTDPEFPPGEESLGKLDCLETFREKSAKWTGEVLWKRVAEVKPKYKTKFADLDLCREKKGQSQFSRFDIKQGNVGDCWFLCSLAELTLHPDLFLFVCPEDNMANNDSHAYHFRFNYNGLWIDVVVDDYVPVCELRGPGNGYRSIGVSAMKDEKEMEAEIWMVLAEKAYAKLHGSYGYIETGDPKNALEHLTGGLGYSTPLDPQNCKLTYKELEKFNFQCGNFAVFFTDTSQHYGEQLANGLIGGHAYSMTGLDKVQVDSVGQVELVRIRNPYGKVEWNADWSDGSPLWDKVSQAEKDRLDISHLEDGEFWMSLPDAINSFVQLDYCYRTDNVVVEDMGEQNQREVKFLVHHGGWSIANGTAGGKGKPYENPQFIVQVGDETDPPDATYDIIVSLLVKAAFKKRYLDNPAFGYQVFWVSDPSCEMWKWTENVGFGSDFFAASEFNKLVKTSHTMNGEEKFYVYGSKVNNRFKLKQGTYLFVPATLEPYEGQYCLRLWWQM